MGAAASLFVRVGADLSGLKKGMADANSTMEDVGRRMAKVAAVAAAAIGAAMLGIGTSAVKSAFAINEEMAKVSTMLDGNLARTKELKAAFQGLAIETGKSAAQDIAPGSYQYLSAFGDVDTVKNMELLVKAGKAGASSTMDAINLASSVIKGFGMTTGDMATVLDKAFKTVSLGQTNFTELAAAIGQVVPMAKTAGVSTDEMFASMATLAGVTGNTAEVATQLRAVMQAFLAPSDAMAAALLKVAQGIKDQSPALKTAMSGYSALSAETKKLEGALSGLASKQKAALDALEAAYKRTSASIAAEARKTERIFSAIAASTNSMLDAALKFTPTAPAGASDAASLSDSQSMLNNAHATGQVNQVDYDKITREIFRATAAVDEFNAAAAYEGRDTTPEYQRKTQAIQNLADMMARLQAQPSKAQDAAEKAYQAQVDARTKSFEAQATLMKAQIEAAKTKMDEYGKSLGTAVIESEGFVGALQLVGKEAHGNSSKLQEMYGSVEALSAVLALSGPQAEDYTRKLGAMSSSAGEAEKAYRAMKFGINAAGEEIASAMQRLKTATESLGDVIGPNLAKAVTALMPYLEQFSAWAASKLGPALEKLAKWMQDDMPRALETMRKWIEGDGSRAFRTFLEDVQNVVAALSNFIDLIGKIANAPMNALNWITDKLVGPVEVEGTTRYWGPSSPVAPASKGVTLPTSRGISLPASSGAQGASASRGITINGGINLPNVTRPDQFARELARDLAMRTGRRAAIYGG